MTPEAFFRPDILAASAYHVPSPEGLIKLDAMEKNTCAMLEQQTTALASTARMEDDGLIDPRDTRKILGAGATAREM